jgi:hypothetical protein
VQKGGEVGAFRVYRMLGDFRVVSRVLGVQCSLLVLVLTRVDCIVE